MRLQLDTEIPSNIQHMQYKTILACEYNKWFLVVDGRSGLWIISVYGLHFPREQLTMLTPIFARLLSPLCGFRGCHHGCSSPRKKSGQDNSQGKASEYFECTRKHYEYGYNITTMFRNINAHDVGHKNKSLMHVSSLFMKMQ